MCVRCPGARRAAHIHHRRPRQMGSSNRDETNSPANGLSLCEACHRWVESNRIAAYAQGYLVHANFLPSQVAVQGPRGPYRLSNDGSKVIDPQEGHTRSRFALAEVEPQV